MQFQALDNDFENAALRARVSCAISKFRGNRTSVTIWTYVCWNTCPRRHINYSFADLVIQLCTRFVIYKFEVIGMDSILSSISSLFAFIYHVHVTQLRNDRGFSESKIISTLRDFGLSSNIW